MKLTLRLKGGAGSGNFGHAGRLGLVGGSMPQGADKGGGGLSTGGAGAVGSDNADKGINKIPTASQLRDVLMHVDYIQKGIPATIQKDSFALWEYKNSKNVFSFGRYHFYTTGQSADSFAKSVEDELKANGYNARIIASGDHDTFKFVGGSTGFNANNTFFGL